MPELPEVETIRRQLREAGVNGRVIETVHVEWPRTVDPLSPAVFRKQVAGCTIERLSRHGKWLIFELDGENNLLVHLRMTGGFYLSQGTLKKGPHDRAILQLSGGLNLHFRDPRKFGRMRLGAFPNGLGPDAMEIGPRQFFQTLEKTNRGLKALLLDQSFIAGVGNIYADEALFEARLHPERRAGTLSEDEKLALYHAVTQVIQAGVRNGGTSLGDGQGNYTDLNGNSGGHGERVKVYGRAGQPCVVCGNPLSQTKVTQRTTVFCAHCQK
ncbi:MAG: bifunctional DNA-formamidopyrimidine glycosylase/DNA-(apurinic or apyrimidinic site) lyase [Verrucomicrobia bacterium]|nr:bifunctional DNA-formamidopyrimidine glycosylase/DNA-(apurinic or apyrimidinic site) lyase [Verrucomicrobiota bacterium]